MPDFKLHPHDFLTKKEIEYSQNFDESSKNKLFLAFTAGVSIDEMTALGITGKTKLSRKDYAALFARHQYKWPHEIAARIQQEPFNDKQLDAVMSLLLLPTMSFKTTQLLNEILYAKFSFEEMVRWANTNRI